MRRTSQSEDGSEQQFEGEHITGRDMGEEEREKFEQNFVSERTKGGFTQMGIEKTRIRNRLLRKLTALWSRRRAGNTSNKIPLNKGKISFRSHFHELCVHQSNKLQDRPDSHQSSQNTRSHSSPPSNDAPITRLLRNERYSSRPIRRRRVLVRADIGESEGGTDVDDGVVAASSVVGRNEIGAS